MSASIEIDIGGTFTDCYVRSDEREVWCKARTTPFDLSQGMSRAIDDAAGRLGLAPGAAVRIAWASDSVHLFDRASGKRRAGDVAPARAAHGDA